MMEFSEQIKKFFEIFEQAKQIVDAPIEWKAKYDLIFSDSISGAIHELGIKIDWYDPDMDYSDDVLAYFNALSDKAKELENFLPRT